MVCYFFILKNYNLIDKKIILYNKIIVFGVSCIVTIVIFEKSIKFLFGILSTSNNNQMYYF